MTTFDLTVFPTEPDETGKEGEGGIFMLTNAEFVAAIFPSVPEGAFAAICSKSGDPGMGGWVANRADRAAGRLCAVDFQYAFRRSIRLGRQISKALAYA